MPELSFATNVVEMIEALNAVVAAILLFWQSARLRDEIRDYRSQWKALEAKVAKLEG